MISPEEKALFQRLEEISGWAIAEHFGCHYSGDADPIDHGGYFYDARDWEWGYAQAVEFWQDDERGRVIAQCGTIHRLEGKAMEDAWESIGINNDEDKASVHAQIDACRSYGGIEPDQERAKGYRLEYWREWRIWKSVSPWLRELGRPR